MNPNPDYLFGHAEVAGLLANGDERVNNYPKYVTECEKRGISCYKEECYNQFMKDCNRVIYNPLHYQMNA